MRSLLLTLMLLMVMPQAMAANVNYDGFSYSGIGEQPPSVNEGNHDPVAHAASLRYEMLQEIEEQAHPETFYWQPPPPPPPSPDVFSPYMRDEEGRRKLLRKSASQQAWNKDNEIEEDLRIIENTRYRDGYAYQRDLRYHAAHPPENIPDPRYLPHVNEHRLRESTQEMIRDPIGRYKYR